MPDPSADRPCRGRFAPSPTGPLHFGSLIAAVGSFLDARSQGGQWLLRMEDLDRPRVVPGAADAILRTLERYGLHWDGEVMWQSRRAEAYLAALERLAAAGHSYPCGCTRREITERGRPGPEGPIYPGTCRNGLPPGREPRALRLRLPAADLEFEDRLLGRFRQPLQEEVGDFVIRRADGIVAYQLAVVVDDASQGITEVVRGSDLLSSTPRQIHLQRLLGLPTPRYLHLPLAVNAAGDKLSKQTRAPSIEDADPAALILRALDFLGQRPPRALQGESLDAIWRWAIAHWDPLAIPAQAAIRVEAAARR
ncbi:tRNA glutamyl-Q(34) synthetase GluQRS [Thiohalobacter sp. IOR34]|uniref:tRNA glutamyl-Q(34) synthetase GluQRS n=1 Tax=Thiohalobacter sp. IOR34 TaxID=3057176 RepID=UPI0025B1BF47|nr:tRNA glutamyl-Q(34) synthetase GluQRS [Thiohalobacter sp. IOR34]WJW76522.1 tRNA glutamyl-Q(34) synthetase GluQRS [Thiohalobacter sp. IOR34]